MFQVSVSALSRNASKVLTAVERTRRPAMVSNHGRFVAVLIPVNEDLLEELVWTYVPEFANSLKVNPEEEYRKGNYRTLDEVMAEAEARRKAKGERARAKAATGGMKTAAAAGSGAKKRTVAKTAAGRTKTAAASGKGAKKPSTTPLASRGTATAARRTKRS